MDFMDPSLGDILLRIKVGTQMPCTTANDMPGDFESCILSETRFHLS